MKGDGIKSTEHMLEHSPTNGYNNTHILATGVSVPEYSRRMCPCDINTTVAVSVPGFCHFACRPFCSPTNRPNLALGVRKNGKGGKERKTKAIDINDLPAERGPQAGASEGPLDTN